MSTGRMRNSRVLQLGILATTAVFLQLFINAMVSKSLGMLLVAMKDDLDADTWVLGFTFALIDGGKEVFAPLAGPLGRKFGARPVVMVAGGMVSLGFIAGSRASSVLLLALTLNLLMDFGQSCTSVLSRATLGKYFDNQMFALASGIAQTGVPLSLLCLPPLVQLLLNAYGWRGAMLVLGSIGAHLVVSGALLIPLPRNTGEKTMRGYQTIPETNSQHPLQEPDKDTHRMFRALRCIFLKLEEVFDLTLMKGLDFWIIALSFVTVRVSKSAWLIYFVPNTVSKGFSGETAAVMVTVAALFQLACVVLVSVAVFKEKVTSMGAMIVTVALMAVSFLIDPWMTSWWSVSANAALSASTTGLAFALAEVMVKEVFGFERMAGAFGLMSFISGIIRPLGGLIPGLIYDLYGSYNLAFVILGAIDLTALVPLLFQRLYRSNRQ